MADRKITDLTALTTPASADVLPIVDVSEAAAADKNKKITVGELFKGVPDGTAAAPAIAFESDDGNGIFLGTTDTVGIATNGSSRMTVSTTAVTSTLPVIVPDGTAAAPSVAFTGSGTDTGVYSPGVDQVAISTGGTGRLFVASDGKIGIGEASAGSYFKVTGLTGASIIEAAGVDTNGFADVEIKSTGTAGSSRLYFSDTAAQSGLIRYSHSSNSMEFSTAGSERARIDSSGRLLVGTSSNRGNWFNSSSWGGALVQVESTTDTNSAFSVVNSSNNGNAPLILLGKNRSGGVGGNTVVQSGDACGQISFFGNDGAEMVEAARIDVAVDATPGSNDMPGRLVFSTTADGSSSPTERMRIDSNGRLYLGSTSQTSNNTVQFDMTFAGGNSEYGIAMNANTLISGTQYIGFNISTTQYGSISWNGSAIAYNTSSDYRLKENIVSLTGATDRVKQLQVRRFNFISNPDTTVDGFIAHEAQAVVPECVTGEKDAVDDDGNPVYQGIDQSKLVPLLTAALQEALAKIETLEAEVTALKGA